MHYSYPDLKNTRCLGGSLPEHPVVCRTPRGLGFKPRRQLDPRRGAILIWFAISLTMLMGMLGLVVDSGYMMASHRHLQGAVDAAALAAAHDLLLDKTERDASVSAMDYLQLRNGVAAAFGTVNIPPSDGVHAGDNNYVEVVALQSISTYFIHLLPGTDQRQTIQCRAVAGFEANRIEDGILLLDPHARPGLSVTGNARITVNGRIAINSEGGGVDETGERIEGSTGFGAFASRFGQIAAKNVSVVGGVNAPERFANYRQGGRNPLKARQPPVSDPLVTLPTPSIQNGVVDVDRGGPSSTSYGVDLNNPNDDSDAPNYTYVDELTGDEVLVLNPGIYTSITIAAGRVDFEPGIYVLRPEPGESFTLYITGGDVRANGVMFYNTGHDYDPVSGDPDKTDALLDRPTSNSQFGEIRFDATMEYAPIDTSLYDYGNASAGMESFNGMFLYQRRSNTQQIQIQGHRGESSLSGTVYAPSARIRMPAQGTYHTQFIVGSMQLPGHADVNLQIDPAKSVSPTKVYLVE